MVTPDIVKTGGNTGKGILIITLYENNNGVYSLIDMKMKNNLQSEDALELSLAGHSPVDDNLSVNGMIWYSPGSMFPTSQNVVVRYSEFDSVQ